MTIRSFLSKLFNWFKSKPANPLPESKPPTTTIIVFVGDKPVGAIQSATISESRNEDFPESTHVTGKFQRVRFDKQKVAEAFSRGFLHVKSQVYPLQVEIRTEGHPTTQIQNVWLTSVGYTYHTDQWIIVDEMEWEAELIKTKNS